MVRKANYELTQTQTTHPARSERLVMLALIGLLLLNLAGLFRMATYEPDCVPAIIESEESE